MAKKYVLEDPKRTTAYIAGLELGVPTRAITLYLTPIDHVELGKNFKPTDYYDIEILLKIKKGENITKFCKNKEEILNYFDIFNKILIFKRLIKFGFTYKADVKFLNWGKSQSFLEPKEEEFKDIEVFEKGAYYTFYTPMGEVVKKVGSNGTVVVRKGEVR